MGWVVFPGPLGIGTKGARKLAAKLASREFGRAISKVAFSKRTLRFVGKQWERAFKHIAEHFAAKTALAAGRANAGVYLRAFQSRQAIQQLITSAVKRSSTRRFSREIIHGVTAGEPVTIVEREFAFVIGESFKEVGGVIVSQGECKVLRVVFNVLGEVVTAFPILKVGA